MNPTAPSAGKRILVLNGHPDAGKEHFDDALAAAYAKGARDAGHEVDLLDIAALDFPLIRSKHSWEKEQPCADIKGAQVRLERADHVLLLYPLWLGDVPALLKAFLEQLLRPGFAFGALEGRLPEKKLRGKSARIVVTIGMPASFYRWFYRAHSLKSLQRNILAFCGMRPVRATLIGLVESQNPKGRLKALSAMERLGRRAQ